MCRATIGVRPVPTQFTECGCIATWISPASPKEEQIDMACEGKTFFIQEYFSDFRKKIERLDELFKELLSCTYHPDSALDCGSDISNGQL
jgi:hypothetical protein